MIFRSSHHHHSSSIRFSFLYKSAGKKEEGLTIYLTTYINGLLTTQTERSAELLSTFLLIKSQREEAKISRRIVTKEEYDKLTSRDRLAGKRIGNSLSREKKGAKILEEGEYVVEEENEDEDEAAEDDRECMDFSGEKNGGL